MKLLEAREGAEYIALSPEFNKYTVCGVHEVNNSKRYQRLSLALLSLLGLLLGKHII